MDEHVRKRQSMKRTGAFTAVFAGTVLAWGAAQAGALKVTAHGIASGGGRAESAGGCRRLEATFGEAAVGRSSGGGYAIVAGFQAGLAGRARDAIFRNGFQECQ